MPEQLRTHLIDRPSNVYEGKPYEFLPSRQSLPPPKEKPKKAKKGEKTLDSLLLWRRQLAVAMYRQGSPTSEITRVLDISGTSVDLILSTCLNTPEYANLPTVDALLASKPDEAPDVSEPDEVAAEAATQRKTRKGKVTDEQVREIRKLEAAGVGRARIGVQYGISEYTVKAIALRQGKYGEVADEVEPIAIVASAAIITARGAATASGIVMNKPKPIGPASAPERGPAFLRSAEPIRPPYVLDYARRMEREYQYSPLPEGCAPKKRPGSRQRKINTERRSTYDVHGTKGATITNSEPSKPRNPFE